ncbi:LacI family DNA-binding transcriptional regulator [Bifidobacterium pullorum]|nr:LacI family DNA-binding transcriptional regulator [Bifidobacterium pullorum]
MVTRSAALSPRIQHAIDDLGYTRRRAPYATGRTRQADTVALVMTDIEHSLFTSIFEGAQEVCEDHGLQLIAMNAMSTQERQSEQVRHLCRMRVSGILLSSVFDSGKDIATATKAGVPLVMIDHENPVGTTTACTIVENNVAAGQMAAAELLACGRRKLMFLGHSEHDFQAIRDRWEGASRYIAQQSVDRTGGIPEITNVDSQGIMIEDGYAMGRVIAAMPANARPDGVIAATDFLAVGLVNALMDDARVSVPDDIAVIGMEGDRLDAVGSMPLTVVQAPGDDMGRQAMHRLLEEMEAPRSHAHATISIMPKLVRRATTPSGGGTDAGQLT